MRNKWVIYLGASVVLVSLGLTYCFYFGFQTLMMVTLRWEARKHPIMWMTPQDLHDQTASTSPTQPLSYCGYEFKLPWNDLEESRTRIWPDRAVLAFKSGNAILLSRMSPHEFSKAVIEQTGKKNFLASYGSAPLESDYAMWKLLAETTPAKVSLRSSVEETASVPPLMVFKTVAAPAETGIFNIHNPDFQGFQWGDPTKEKKKIVLDLFATDGGVEVVIVGKPRPDGTFVSQPEINMIVQSIRRKHDTSPVATLTQ